MVIFAKVIFLDGTFSYVMDTIGLYNLMCFWIRHLHVFAAARWCHFFFHSRIPFTIQRLCELLTEPKRNYTGTDKFLRGVEKVSPVLFEMHIVWFWTYADSWIIWQLPINMVTIIFSLPALQNVMVVSCIYPSTEWVSCIAGCLSRFWSFFHIKSCDWPEDYCFTGKLFPFPVQRWKVTHFPPFIWNAEMNVFDFEGKMGLVTWTEWMGWCCLQIPPSTQRGELTVDNS